MANGSPQPTVVNPQVATLLAVVSSVCVVAVTAWLGASPALKLVGAAAGAAIPAVIGVAGSH